MCGFGMTVFAPENYIRSEKNATPTNKYSLLTLATDNMILYSLGEGHLYWGDIPLQYPLAVIRTTKPLVSKTVFGFEAVAGLEEGLKVVLQSVSASKLQSKFEPLQN